MARTTRQRTWRQRRRPPPTPTTEEATTWVVLTGAPITDAPSRTAVDPVWLASASIGRIRMMRRPSVRTIGQPPIAVPAVSAAPHASSTHVGDARCWSSPPATSNNATTPTAFCASFAPWVSARPSDMTHWPARTGPRTRRVLRRAARRSAAVDDEPGHEAQHRRDRQHRRDAEHADGLDAVEAAPVHRARASLGERGTDETAEQRVSRARRQAPPPGDAVPGHRARERGAEDRDHLVRRDGDDACDRARHRGAEQERAEDIARCRERAPRCPGERPGSRRVWRSRSPRREPRW